MRFDVLAHVLLCLFILEGCSNDLFIDRESMDVRVEGRELDFTGGKSIVKYKAYSGEYFEISVHCYQADETIVICDYDKITGSKLIDNGIFKMNVDFNRDNDKNEIKLDLCHSFYTDTVYIDLGRNVYNTWQYETVKVLPASPAVVKSISYDNGYFDGGQNNDVVTLNYVNSSDEVKKYTLINKYVAQYKGYFEPHDETGMKYIFGEKLPEVDAVVVRDGLVVKTDSKIPYSTDTGLIPGEYMSIDEPLIVDVPPRAFCQAKIMLKMKKYIIPYSITVENNDIGDVNIVNSGFFNLFVPEDYTVSVNNYSLETGEEI